MSEYAVSHPVRADLHRDVPVRGPNFPQSLLPGRRVHSVDEQHAVQVIRLVLQAAGEDLRPDDLDGIATVGEPTGDRVQPSLHVVVDAGEGQASLLTLLLLLVGELEDWVHDVPALAADRISEH